MSWDEDARQVLLEVRQNRHEHLELLKVAGELRVLCRHCRRHARTSPHEKPAPAAGQLLVRKRTGRQGQLRMPRGRGAQARTFVHCGTALCVAKVRCVALLKHLSVRNLCVQVACGACRRVTGASSVGRAVGLRPCDGHSSDATQHARSSPSRSRSLCESSSFLPVSRCIASWFSRICARVPRRAHTHVEGLKQQAGRQHARTSSCIAASLASSCSAPSLASSILRCSTITARGVRSALNYCGGDGIFRSSRVSPQCVGLMQPCVERDD